MLDDALVDDLSRVSFVPQDEADGVPLILFLYRTKQAVA